MQPSLKPPIKFPPRKKVQCRPYFQFAKLSASRPTPSLRKISPAQLSQHSTPQSAWISIDGNIYDVTEYLEYHPGGDVILQGCGKDGTELFSIQWNYVDGYHSFVNHGFMLGKWKVGVLVKDEIQW